MPADQTNVAALPHAALSTLEAEGAPVMLQGFLGVSQAQTQWCWAAAAASIYNYYRTLAGDKWPELRQCDYVKCQLKKPGCFSQPRPASCLDSHDLNRDADEQGQLYDELKRLGLLDCEP